MVTTPVPASTTQGSIERVTERPTSVRQGMTSSPAPMTGDGTKSVVMDSTTTSGGMPIVTSGPMNTTASDVDASVVG